LPASSPLPPAPLTGTTADPASQLVTELFESIKLKSDTDKPIKPAVVSKPSEPKQPPPPVTDFKAGLRKVNQHPLSQDKGQEQQGQQINFKSQLKKTNTALYAQPQQEQDSEQESGKVDFKAQLKKVKASKPSVASDSVSDSPDLSNVKASLRSLSKNSLEQEAEDKRKSTGSISSLKKMWEQPQRKKKKKKKEYV